MRPQLGSSLAYAHKRDERRVPYVALQDLTPVSDPFVTATRPPARRSASVYTGSVAPPAKTRISSSRRERDPGAVRREGDAAARGSARPSAGRPSRKSMEETRLSGLSALRLDGGVTAASVSPTRSRRTAKACAIIPYVCDRYRALERLAAPQLEHRLVPPALNRDQEAPVRQDAVTDDVPPGRRLGPSDNSAVAHRRRARPR